MQYPKMVIGLLKSHCVLERLSTRVLAASIACSFLLESIAYFA